MMSTPSTTKRQGQEPKTIIRQSVKRLVKPNIPLSPKKTDKQQVENNLNDPLNPLLLSAGQPSTYQTATNRPPSQSLYLKPIQAELELPSPEEKTVE